jgi:high-affinity Fe2+/Pb2+ permease
MNVSKFIVTILATALYTSSIWCLSVLNLENFNVVSLIIIAFGGVAILAGIGYWLLSRWDDR